MPDIEKLKSIVYTFRFHTHDGDPEAETDLRRRFPVFLDPQSHDLVLPVREEEPLPEWTKLGFSQCHNCPLATDEYQHCPPARALVEVVDFFSNLPSFKDVEVRVSIHDRQIEKRTTVQEGLRSLMGLIMATSGCPVLAKLRPMTIIHTPFSTIDETIFQAVGAFLIRQYYTQRYGGDGKFDLEGLKNIYQEIHQVNRDFQARLKHASSDDANLNGLVNLDLFTFAVPKTIDKELNKFLHIFNPELQDNDDQGSCR